MSTVQGWRLLPSTYHCVARTLDKHTLADKEECSALRLRPCVSGLAFQALSQARRLRPCLRSSCQAKTSGGPWAQTWLL